MIDKRPGQKRRSYPPLPPRGSERRKRLIRNNLTWAIRRMDETDVDMLLASLAKVSPYNPLIDDPLIQGIS